MAFLWQRRHHGYEDRVAVSVSAIERLETKRASGIIEFADLDLHLVTLRCEGGFKTFELDPENAVVRVEGELVSLDKLKQGQRASIRYVPSVRALGFRDSAPETRG